MQLMEVSKCWKNFQKFQLKWKFLKDFTRPKQRTVLKKLFSPSTDKSFLCLWSKNFLTEIYRNIQTFAFHVLRECSFWVPRNRAVQFSLTPTKNMFAGKFLKWIWLCCWSIFFIMLSEVRFLKWVRFFECNCIVKWVNFFATFIGLETFYNKNWN